MRAFSFVRVAIWGRQKKDSSPTRVLNWNYLSEKQVCQSVTHFRILLSGAGDTRALLPAEAGDEWHLPLPCPSR